MRGRCPSNFTSAASAKPYRTKRQSALYCPRNQQNAGEKVGFSFLEAGKKGGAPTDSRPGALGHDRRMRAGRCARPGPVCLLSVVVPCRKCRTVPPRLHLLHPSSRPCPLGPQPHQHHQLLRGNSVYGSGPRNVCWSHHGWPAEVPRSLRFRAARPQDTPMCYAQESCRLKTAGKLQAPGSGSRHACLADLLSRPEFCHEIAVVYYL